MKKRILAVLMAGLIVANFAGCSSDKGDGGANDSNNAATEVTEVENKVVETKEDTPVKEASSKIITLGQFQSFIGKYVDLSNYKDPDTSGKHCYYTLKKENQKDYDLDFTIKLDGNAKITMPASASSFAGQGWKIPNDTDASYKLKPGYSTGAIWKYNDKKITAHAVNLSDVEASYDKGSIHRILFSLYNIESGVAEKYDTAPEFTVCNSITNASDIEDIISRLGEPTNINFSVIGDSFSKIELRYSNDNANEYISFVLSSDGAVIASVDYSSDVSK